MMNPADPGYPHGTRIGYKHGCTATSPCPATPTCTEYNSDLAKQYRRRKKLNQTTEGRTTTYVLSRARETVEKVGAAVLADYTGLTVDRIHALLDRSDPATAGTMVPEPVAAALDEGWAWLAHGKDVRALTRHGHRTSYDHGLCRCEPCRACATRVRKNTTAGIKTDQSLAPVTPRIVAHVDALVAAVGPTELARMVGISPQALYRLRKGQHEFIRYGTLRALTALTISKARAQVDRSGEHLVPVAPARHIVGTLNALGYPTWWILREAGIGNAPGRAGFKTVEVGRLTKLQEVAARVGDRPATVEHGFTLNSISKTKRRARKAGFWPPAMYDDGVLDVRSIPEHRFAGADERCARDVAIAEALTRGRGETIGQIAARLDISEKTIERLIKDLPFGFVYDGHNEQSWIRKEDLPAATRIRDITTAYEDGKIGPVTAALQMGTRLVKNLPKDHPEVLAWRAAHPEVEQVEQGGQVAA